MNEPTENTDNANPQVVLETELGRIVIEVIEDRAPRNAAYFLEFVGNGDYDGGSFYRAGASVAAEVHPSPIIQGGFLWNAENGEFSLEHDGARVETLPAFDTTEDSSIKHARGTVSLARDILASGDGIPEFSSAPGTPLCLMSMAEPSRTPGGFRPSAKSLKGWASWIRSPRSRPAGLARPKP